MSNNNTAQSNAEYKAPLIELIGSIEEITRGLQGGTDDDPDPGGNIS